MRYGLFLAVIVAALIYLFAKGVYEEKQKKERFIKELRSSYGRLPRGYVKSAERAEDAGAAGCGERFPDGCLQTIRGRFVIDSITWKELDMEAVFSRLDYTLSRAGEECLYALLHCPARNPQEAGKWEEAAEYFASHQDERAGIQALLAEIGKKGLPCFACLEKIRSTKAPEPAREYIADGLYGAAFVLLVISPAPGLAFLAALILYQIVTYFRERAYMAPCLEAASSLIRLIRGAEKLHKSLGADIEKRVEQGPGVRPEHCIRRLQTLKRHSFWVLQSGGGGSSPLSLLADYARMLFHPDLIQFAVLKEKIAALEPEIRDIFLYIGSVDVCISIAMYRASLEYWCIPRLYEAGEGAESRFAARDCYHPLLERPVANSISLSGDRGVLLTGSNASGKSTFLKMTAVNLLLAQTVHTALAGEFSAPFCRIYTDMQDGGSIRRGESSYMAEILSLKRIVDAGKEEKGPVFCFIDEILRGTNTVERIAASAQILKSIRPPAMYCFAATHDRELTRLLEEEYDNYYFTEEIKDGDIIFPYKLLKGRADTGNAIRLLEAVGYDGAVVSRAARSAERFLREGVWK